MGAWKRRAVFFSRKKPAISRFVRSFVGDECVFPHWPFFRLAPNVVSFLVYVCVRQNRQYYRVNLPKSTMRWKIKRFPPLLPSFRIAEQTSFILSSRKQAFSSTALSILIRRVFFPVLYAENHRYIAGGGGYFRSLERASRGCPLHCHTNQPFACCCLST